MSVITSDPLLEFFRGAMPNTGANISIQHCITISRIFFENHCCPRCCLRFLGCVVFPLYSLKENDLYNHFNNVFRSAEQPELPAYDPSIICTACLGSLQSINDYVDGASDELKRQDYKVDSVCVQCTLPVSILSRDHLLKSHAVEILTKDESNSDLLRIWTDINTRDPKDSFRYLFGIVLKEKTGLQPDINAGFCMTVVLKHEPTAKEHLFLANLKKPLLHIKTVRHKKVRVTVGDARSRVVEALKSLDSQEAKSVTAVPPTKATERAQFDNVALINASSHVGGRYLKFSREYSQTPWSVRGVKLAEHSVSDCFADLIRDYHRADATKFVTAGREDSNVRMLGTGRPFYLEVVNPRTPRLSKSEYQKIQEEINSNPIHKDNVQVRDLCFVKPEHTKAIKDGEQTKTKHYKALIWLSQPLTDELVERINKVGSTPFTIYQKTPVRVFQRRATAIREKEIHTSTITRLKKDVDMNSVEARYGVLKLHTQAGTYIKEYVHGDLGRTMPNLASVSGIQSADLLELDVMDVDLVWPIPENTDIETTDKDAGTLNNGLTENNKRKMLI